MTYYSLQSRSSTSTPATGFSTSPLNVLRGNLLSTAAGFVSDDAEQFFDDLTGSTTVDFYALESELVPTRPIHKAPDKDTRISVSVLSRKLRSVYDYTHAHDDVALPVSDAAVRNAEYFFAILANVSSNLELQIGHPHVTTDGEGRVQLEWWNGVRKLSIFVEAHRVEYIRVFGTNIHTDMVEGELNFLSDTEEVLNWISDA